MPAHRDSTPVTPSTPRGRAIRPAAARNCVLALAGALAVATAAAPAAQTSSEPLTLTDLAGRRVSPFDAAGRGIAFVFVRADCPISSRYMPELERLRQRAGAAGVSMWLVFVDPTAPPASLADYLDEFGYRGAALVDASHRLVELAGASITPEAAVFAGSPAALVYRGRIDDWYAAPGRRRPRPTSHDLLGAMETLAAGKIPDRRETSAVGCTIADLRQ